jgi:hypothetical protein
LERLPSNNSRSLQASAAPGVFSMLSKVSKFASGSVIALHTPALQFKVAVLKACTENAA